MYHLRSHNCCRHHRHHHHRFDHAIPNLNSVDYTVDIKRNQTGLVLVVDDYFLLLCLDNCRIGHKDRLRYCLSFLTVH